MIQIPLTKNQHAIIDDEDYEKVNQFKWYARYDKNVKSYYANVKINKKSSKVKFLIMHRYIMDCPKGKIVDHINHDTLDNRKSNLRICTYSQNQMNRKIMNTNKIGLKGVFKLTNSLKYGVEITVNKKRINIGRFENRFLAAKAYNKAAKKYFGEYAYLNDVPNNEKIQDEKTKHNEKYLDKVFKIEV